MGGSQLYFQIMHSSAAGTVKKITCEYDPLNAHATEPTYLLLLPAVLGFEVHSQSVQFQMLAAVR